MLREGFVSPTSISVATVNPEMLLAARKKRDVAHVLRQMTWRIPDGFGITLLSRIRGEGRVPRYPGVDLLLDLCRMGAKGGKRLFLLGGWGTVTDQAASVLMKAFPGLNVEGIGDVEIGFEDGIWRQPSDLLARIRGARPDILAVALGGSVSLRQERWILEHLHQLPTVRIALGVGGALDMISGRLKRAPKWMRAFGIEWFWRFLQEPRRFPRIFSALILFPFFALLDRIHRTTLYDY